MSKRITLFICLLGLALHLQAQVDVLTQRNDNMRTGWNNLETILDTTNVKPGKFGKLFSHAVDDLIYTQPLIVNNVTIPGKGVKNVVYVATANNSVYAFDADNASAANAYWNVNLTPSGSRPPNKSDFPASACGNFHNNIGTIGTPVIDKNSQTMYLVARSVPAGGFQPFQQFLHALDIRTGLEKTGSPVLVTAQMAGTGDGQVGGLVTFDPFTQNQRCSLLLLNSIVYIAYSSHCDFDPYHGWILGYNASTLQQTIVYNTTPDGKEGSIWMSGAGPAADENGNIYVAVANGTVGDGNNPPPAGRNRSESLLKLTPSGSTLTISSYFTPKLYAWMNAGDYDMGPIQVLLIPNSTFALTGSKDGRLFLANRDNMGGYNANEDNILQTITLNSTANLHSSYGYYKGTAKEFIYSWPENIELEAYPLNRGASKLGVANMIKGTLGPQGQTGAFLSVSSNGSSDASAILWASHAANACDAEVNNCPGILHAFSAIDVTREIWNSNMNPADNCGNFSKFVAPTIANGKVYMSTFSNQLVIYGLNDPPPLPVTLVSFTGQNIDDQYVLLEWSVATQVNNSHFELERSTDGSNFRSIASIEGSGNSNSLQLYSKKDMTPVSGVNFYRLKQVDLDGKSSFSNIVMVRFGKQENPLIYPNPARTIFTIVAGQQPINEIIIFDMLGKTVKKIMNPARASLLNVPAANLAPGIYIVQIRTNSQVVLRKLTISK